MIEGVLRHCTEIIVNKQYVDSHGQSEVAFAFCHLFGFELLPRLKAIHAQKLYRVEAGQPEEYPNLELVLTRATDWILIRQSPGLVENCVGLYVPLSEFNQGLKWG
jgi:TnpA family transposase